VLPSDSPDYSAAQDSTAQILREAAYPYLAPELRENSARTLSLSRERSSPRSAEKTPAQYPKIQPLNKGGPPPARKPCAYQRLA